MTAKRKRPIGERVHARGLHPFCACFESKTFVPRVVVFPGQRNPDCRLEIVFPDEDSGYEIECEQALSSNWGSRASEGWACNDPLWIFISTHSKECDSRLSIKQVIVVRHYSTVFNSGKNHSMTVLLKLVQQNHWKLPFWSQHFPSRN